MQKAPTQKADTALNHFLAYAATYPDACVTFHKSDMRLIVHSDASYLSEDESRSRAAGYFFLSDHSASPALNGAIDVMSKVIPAVVASAFEAEYAAMFMNAQTAESIRSTLVDLGYPQDATPIIADNLTAVNVVNKVSAQRRSKAIDMRFHWIRDRVEQGHFNIFWLPGTSNLADFFTKIHSPSHHINMRAHYVH